MNRRFPRLLIIVPLLLTLMAWAFVERRILLVRVLAVTLAESELFEPSDQGPDANWIDDYYTVQKLDERTFAIGEPRYAQQNFSYLIVGSDRAVLFDAGPGVRDIRPIAESLTDRPITFVPSHFHYDHLGDGVTFSSVAVVDLPDLRARAPNDELTLTNREHLGFAEGFAIPTLTITEWIKPGEAISLGDRSLLILHTPGHTHDSISLVEAATGWVFTGDFIYPGPLFAFLPGGGMGDYLDGAEAILHSAPTTPRLLAAHRSAMSGLPELTLEDVEDLKRVLEEIRGRDRPGEGIYPVTYQVNEEISLVAEPRWLQTW